MNFFNPCAAEADGALIQTMTSPRILISSSNCGAGSAELFPGSISWILERPDQSYVPINCIVHRGQKPAGPAHEVTPEKIVFDEREEEFEIGAKLSRAPAGFSECDSLKLRIPHQLVDLMRKIIYRIMQYDFVEGAYARLRSRCYAIVYEIVAIPDDASAI